MLPSVPKERPDKVKGQKQYPNLNYIVYPNKTFTLNICNIMFLKVMKDACEGNWEKILQVYLIFLKNVRV